MGESQSQSQSGCEARSVVRATSPVRARRVTCTAQKTKKLNAPRTCTRRALYYAPCTGGNPQARQAAASTRTMRARARVKHGLAPSDFARTAKIIFVLVKFSIRPAPSPAENGKPEQKICTRVGPICTCTRVAFLRPVLQSRNTKKHLGRL